MSILAEHEHQWPARLLQGYGDRPAGESLCQLHRPLFHYFRRMIHLALFDGRRTDLTERPHMLAIRPIDPDKGSKLELNLILD